MVGGILGLVLVLGLCAVAVYALTGDDAEPPPTTTNSSKQYGTPPDGCTLLDASQVEGWAGTPTSKKPEQAIFPADLGGDVDGCRYELVSDAIMTLPNTLILFVSANGHAKQRHDSRVGGKQIPELVERPIPGLGTGATGYSEQGKDKNRILAGLFVYDKNLYLEIRFNGFGSRPWSVDEVERDLVGVTRAVLAKIPVS